MENVFVIIFLCFRENYENSKRIILLFDLEDLLLKFPSQEEKQQQQSLF